MLFFPFRFIFVDRVGTCRDICRQRKGGKKEASAASAPRSSPLKVNFGFRGRSEKGGERKRKRKKTHTDVIARRDRLSVDCGPRACHPPRFGGVAVFLVLGCWCSSATQCLSITDAHDGEQGGKRCAPDSSLGRIICVRSSRSCVCVRRTVDWTCRSPCDVIRPRSRLSALPSLGLSLIK